MALSNGLSVNDLGINELSSNSLSGAVSEGPSSVTLELWLDASDAPTITETLGNVSIWEDKSGNNRDLAQVNPIYQPTYAANTVTFSNGLQELTTTGAAAAFNFLSDGDAFIMFMVCKIDPINNTTFIFSNINPADGTVGMVLRLQGYGELGAGIYRSNGAVVSPLTTTTADFSTTTVTVVDHLAGGTPDVTPVGFIYQDNVLVSVNVDNILTSSGYETSIGTDIHIGNIFDLANNATFELKELKIYKGFMNSTDRVAASTALAVKWGL